MILQEKYKELIQILEDYLKNKISGDDFDNFLWDIIDFFSNEKNNKSISRENFEKIFWFAVWNCLHLTSEPAEEPWVRQTFEEILAYLKKEKKLPPDKFSFRPLDNKPVKKFKLLSSFFKKLFEHK